MCVSVAIAGLLYKSQKRAKFTVSGICFCRQLFGFIGLLDFRYASYLCAPITTLLGLRWTIRNTDYLKKDQACIVVSNHQSSLDILGKFGGFSFLMETDIGCFCIGMFQFWHIMDKCTVIAKKELMYCGPFGLGSWLCGLVFIPRFRSDLAKQIMFEASKKITREKVTYNLCICFSCFAVVLFVFVDVFA